VPSPSPPLAVLTHATVRVIVQGGGIAHGETTAANAEHRAVGKDAAEAVALKVHLTRVDVYIHKHTHTQIYRYIDI